MSDFDAVIFGFACLCLGAAIALLIVEKRK